MKLVMTLLVRDEDDIVSSNIEYHLSAGVDFIIAMDNLSVDGTTEILKSYENSGVLRYIHQPSDDFNQRAWVTHMARLASVDHDADWVINCDADEFWWPDQGGLKQALDGAPTDCVALSVQRCNFAPRRMDPDAFFAEALTLRETRSLNGLGEPLPPKVCHRALADIGVTQGNHKVLRSGQILTASDAPMTIFHFPVRSYPRFANKIAKGGAAYARNTELEPTIGKTWRRLYQDWLRGELPAYYDSLILDEAAVGQALADGRLVHDDRLKATLARLPRWADRGVPAPTAAMRTADA